MLRVFPPEQHGELSVLDNKLIAVAKESWRKIRKNEDFSYDALLLLKCINEVKQKDITKWYDQNYLLKKKKLDVGVVKGFLNQVKGRQILRESKKEHYIESYLEWKREDE